MIQMGVFNDTNTIFLLSINNALFFLGTSNKCESFFFCGRLELASIGVIQAPYKVPLVESRDLGGGKTGLCFMLIHSIAW